MPATPVKALKGQGKESPAAPQEAEPATPAAPNLEIAPDADVKQNMSKIVPYVQYHLVQAMKRERIFKQF